MKLDQCLHFLHKQQLKQQQNGQKNGHKSKFGTRATCNLLINVTSALLIIFDIFHEISDLSTGRT